MFLLNAIKSNPKLKKIVHWLLIPRGQARPKLWVRLFINPIFHKKGRSNIIRFNTRVGKKCTNWSRKHISKKYGCLLNRCSQSDKGY